MLDKIDVKADSVSSGAFISFFANESNYHTVTKDKDKFCERIL